MLKLFICIFVEKNEDPQVQESYDRRVPYMNLTSSVAIVGSSLSLFSGSLCFVLKGKAARFYTIFYEVILLVACGFVLWYIVTTGEAVSVSSRSREDAD